MLISSIIRGKKKIIVQFEDASFIELIPEIYYKSNFREENDVDTVEIEHFKYLNDERILKEYSLKILSIREYSENSIFKKLKNKIDNDRAIRSVINYLKESKYINDYEYAKHYIENKLHRDNKGLYKIKIDLVNLGISESIIEELCANISDTLQIDIAIKLANKKIKSINNNTEIVNTKGKIFRFLMSKGFDTEICFTVVNQLIKF
ncbi:MAG: RecX family transcriptional regulator [bacterium]